MLRLSKLAAISVVIVMLLASILIVLEITSYPKSLRPQHYSSSAVLVEHARLISMANNRPMVENDQSVLVVDGTIVGVGLTGSLQMPGNVDAESLQVIDAAGQTLLPGLIDAHVHLWDEAELAAYLAYGVTSVRNMSGLPFHLSIAQRISEGQILGPDVITTGPILNSPGPNQQDNHVLVTTAEEARQAVQRQHAAGFDTLKVYSNLRTEAYEAIRTEARLLGMELSGHTPEGVRPHGVPYDRPFTIEFEDILDDGFTTIEHVESIVWHGLRDNLDTDEMEQLARLIAASDVAVTPTLLAHDNLVRVAESGGDYLERPGIKMLNPFITLFEAGSYSFWSTVDPARREQPRRDFYRTATGILHEAGVTLVAGTDAGIFTNIPGIALSEELELLVASGLTPYEALTTATVNAAGAIGLPDRGQVAPGFRANLVLISNDPLAEITAMRDPSAVMIGGVWLDSSSLQELKTGATDTSLIRTAWHLLPVLFSTQ